MRLIFIILILSVIALPGICLSLEISTEILQIKMNRVYFAVGEEANIFKDCSFTIIKSDDTLSAGYIEASYPGISYSYQTEYALDSLNIDSCTVSIKPAGIDSLTPINIGILKSIPYGASSNFPGLTAATSAADSANRRLSSQGNILHTYFYDSDIKMLIDFESGLIDAFISYQKEWRPNISINSIESPAPFYVALIPNISKAVNSKGFLTTSLYYRFNEERLAAFFEGDNIVPCFSLYPDHTKPERWYGFNPADGRNLLNYLDKKPKSIAILIEANALKRLALYFGDILSRDKIRTKFTDDSSRADISFKFIPLHENYPDSSLTYILDLISHDLPVESKINSVISEIRQQLEMAGQANSVETQRYYLNLAQRTLIEDLGIFPLLRPSLFFAAGDNLKGCRFDRHGRLELGNLRKVILPQIPAGDTR